MVEAFENRPELFGGGLGEKLARAAPEGPQNHIGVVAWIDRDHGHRGRGISDRKQRLLLVRREIYEADIAAVVDGEAGDGARTGIVAEEHGFGGARLGQRSSQAAARSRARDRLPAASRRSCGASA